MLIPFISFIIIIIGIKLIFPNLYRDTFCNKHKNKYMELTPMHQLLDWFKDQSAPTKDELELKILELTNSEKKVIIESVNDTINVFVAAGFKDIKADAKTDLGEIYYKEKFNEYEQKF